MKKKEEYPELLFTEYIDIQLSPGKNGFKLISSLKSLEGLDNKEV
jgi:hypothetical protein